MPCTTDDVDARIQALLDEVKAEPLPIFIGHGAERRQLTRPLDVVAVVYVSRR